MRRLASLGLVSTLLLLCLQGAGYAKRPGISAQRPIFPKRDKTDEQLFDKACRIQARMWAHIAPEGLFVDTHRVGADPDQLSFDALSRSDAAMWSGCYAASQACRWNVTRDPDALLQVRVLARGLALLSDATGTPGRFARNVGRVPEGKKPPNHVVASPSIDGIWFRSDVSRDQLAGLTLGWACIAKFVDDEELLALARTQLAALTDRIRADGMKLKDYRGKTPEHGEIEKEIRELGFIKIDNGMHAAIGYAPFVVAAGIDAGPKAEEHLRHLRKKKWHEAIDKMHSAITVHLSASNVFMTDVALLSIRLWAEDGKSQRRALDGIRALRTATVGWWNAGFCACQLLGGMKSGRREILGEIRATLHQASEEEVPPARVEKYAVHRAATARERGITSWAWKSQVDIVRAPARGSPLHDETHSRADWLFAYWLARAAGELEPASGPGASDAPILSGIEAPAWAHAMVKAPR